MDDVHRIWDAGGPLARTVSGTCGVTRDLLADAAAAEVEIRLLKYPAGSVKAAAINDVVGHALAAGAPRDFREWLAARYPQGDGGPGRDQGLAYRVVSSAARAAALGIRPWLDVGQGPPAWAVADDARGGLEEEGQANGADPIVAAVQTLVAHDRWTEALDRMDAAIGADPTSIARRIARADLLIKLGRAGEALDDLNTALEIDPNHHPALLKRSKVHRVLKHYELARIDAARVAASPDVVEALIELSKLWQSQRLFSTAIEAAEAALQINPRSVQAMDAKAEAQYAYGTGDVQAALALVNAVIAEDPAYTPARILRIKLFYDLGQPAQSIAAAQALLQEFPGHTRLLWGLVNFYGYGRGDLSAALAIAQPALTQPPQDPALGKTWAAVLYLLGHPKEAMAQITVYANRFPRDRGAEALRTRWLAQAAEPRSSAADPRAPRTAGLEENGALGPGWYFRMAQRAMYEERWPEAEAAWTKVLDLNRRPHDPKNARIYMGRARARIAQGHFSGAEQDCGEVIRLNGEGNPLNAPAFHVRADARAAQRRFRGAIRDWSALIALLERRGRGLLDSRDLRDLETAYRERGRLKLELKHYAEARADMWAAIQISPQNAGAYITLAEIAVGFGRHDEAKRYAKAALEIAPRSTGALLELARAELGLDELTAAESHIREVIRLNPQKALAYGLLADILERQGRSAEALAAREKALHLAATRRPLTATGGLEEWGTRIVFGLGRLPAAPSRGGPATAVEELESSDDLVWYS